MGDDSITSSSEEDSKLDGLRARRSELEGALRPEDGPASFSMTYREERGVSDGEGTGDSVTSDANLT